jgi:hypothetical protein
MDIDMTELDRPLVSDAGVMTFWRAWSGGSMGLTKVGEQLTRVSDGRAASFGGQARLGLAGVLISSPCRDCFLYLRDRPSIFPSEVMRAPFWSRSLPVHRSTLMLLWDSGATLGRNALGEEVDADIGVFGITVEDTRRLGRDNAETELIGLFLGKLGR